MFCIKYEKQKMIFKIFLRKKTIRAAKKIQSLWYMIYIKSKQYLNRLMNTIRPINIVISTSNKLAKPLGIVGISLGPKSD